MKNAVIHDLTNNVDNLKKNHDIFYDAGLSNDERGRSATNSSSEQHESAWQTAVSLQVAASYPNPSYLTLPSAWW